MTSPSELITRVQAALGAHYRIERELGHGGMGVVFLARDTTLDRPVAVKVVHPELAVHSSITQRFLAEARMIARLRHSNIVAIHSAGETAGLFYYVMDYVPGESLRQRLGRGRLTAAESTRILADLADALDASGRAGLVHRDVKPENVLLDSGTGRALLADFGIARAMAIDTAAGITAQGLAVGTPTYMSPEQAAGEPVDPRSDLYSLGVVGYEMVVGHPPFQGSNSAAVVSMHLSERPQEISALRADSPPALNAAIMRALAKSPDDRWQSGDAFRRALTGDVAGATPVRKRRSRRVALAVGAAVVGLALIFAAATRHQGGPPRGLNPRHSILILPFDNLRKDAETDWLRDGSVSMLGLNLSQWNDLTVVDHERLHDLLARRGLRSDSILGLEMARQLARDAGVWTVVLGEFDRAGDSLHLVARVFDVATGQRVDVARVDDRNQSDIRPLFDEMAAKLLNLSGAPGGVRTQLALSTTPSLEAYRAYLRGLEKLNQWNLTSAEVDFRQAVKIDTTFGLAYYKLALTRGWIAGASDSAAILAIDLAMRHSSRLPAHDQAMIAAYRAFLQGEFAASREAYRQLLARDSTDADAWYGLADVSFHDSSSSTRDQHWTQSLRAFKRTLALDPNYYLAYEHINQIYNLAAQNHPVFALLSGDSLVFGMPMGGRHGPDSSQLRAAIRLARTDGVASARRWITSQPENPHAQKALIQAYIASEDYPSALAEVDQIQRSPDATTRPDLPFIRARVQLAAGHTEAARTTVEAALDSTSAEKFDATHLPTDTYAEILGSSNVLAYSGHIASAARALTLANDIRKEWHPDDGARGPAGPVSLTGQLLLGHLYASVGAPMPELRRSWREVESAARAAPPDQRGGIAAAGWASALGLFINGESGDQGPLKAQELLSEETLPPEVQALQAIARKDTTEARRLLALPDSMTTPTWKQRPQWWGYKVPLAAEAHYLLHDYATTVDLLKDFEPAQFNLGTFDVRWGLAGRVRLLRAMAFEKLGKIEEAKAEYRSVLAQWETADESLQPFINEARLRLARVSGTG